MSQCFDHAQDKNVIAKFKNCLNDEKVHFVLQLIVKHMLNVYEIGRKLDVPPN